VMIAPVETARSARGFKRLEFISSMKADALAQVSHKKMRTFSRGEWQRQSAAQVTWEVTSIKGFTLENQGSLER
jgi:hypothetical protein